MRMAARIVLSGEFLVVLFAGLVARGMQDASGLAVLLVCLGVVVLLVLALGTLSRGVVGYALGSLVQVLLLVSTYWIHLMAVVGAVFAVLWVVALVQGRKADELRAARLSARD